MTTFPHNQAASLGMKCPICGKDLPDLPCEGHPRHGTLIDPDRKEPDPLRVQVEFRCEEEPPCRG